MNVSGKLFFIQNIDEIIRILTIEGKLPLENSNNRKNLESWIKKHIRNISCFCPCDSYYSTIHEVNYAHLLSFLNTDFENIEKLLSSISNHILTKQPFDDSTNIIQEIFDNLVNCHPLFYNEVYPFILDSLIITHINSIIMHTSFSVLDEIDFENEIEKIISGLTLNYSFDSSNLSVKDLAQEYYHLYSLTYPYGHSMPLCKLACIKDFQKEIIKNIPHVTREAQSTEWNIFLQNLSRNYGPIEKTNISMYDSSDDDTTEKFFDISASIEPKHLSHTYFSDPEKYYTIHSFQQYIIVLLSTFKNNKCAIKFCFSCGTYYITPMYLNGKNHTKCSESIPNYQTILKIKQNTYNRLYQRAYSKGEEYLLASTGFLQFHDNTFNLVLFHKISPKVYESYTKEKDYDYNNFSKLKSVIDYNISIEQ